MMKMTKPALAGLLTAAFAAGAWSAPANDAAARAMALHRMALQRAGYPVPAAQPASGALDTTPPSIKSFRITPPANAAAALAQVVVDLQGTDDLSGVQSVSLTLSGPHGQLLQGVGHTQMPGTKYSTKFAMDVSAYTEPGTWTATSAFISDYAGNWVFYDAQQLASLGNASVTIGNSHPELVDTTPPTLTGGVVLTPTASLSSTFPGTTQIGGMIGANFDVSDAGSGVLVVGATWCNAQETCLSTGGSRDVLRNSQAVTQLTTSQIVGWMAAGTYTLKYVSLQDHAGNYVYLLGTEFGGTADFGALMPAGHTITLTP